jgi:hypothetical protein
MKKAKEFGKLTEALASTGISPVAESKTSSQKFTGPSLNIRASVDSYGMGDEKWRREERKRLKEELKVLKGHIANFDHKAAGEKVLRSLKTETAMKQARLMETEAMLDENEDEDEDKGGEEKE